MSYENPNRSNRVFKACLPVGLLSLLVACSSGTPIADSKPLNSTQSPTPPSPIQGQKLPISALTKLGGRTIRLEVALTPQQQAMGLMYRTSMPEDTGMLFPFQPPRVVSFWMKNVVINLDMVFIRNGQIRAIAANVPPCKTEPCPMYGPSEAIDQVIELRGGRAAELGLKVGDRVTIQFLRPFDPPASSGGGVR
ncbi:MAG: DUF192 domain-containing protein [Leptolyngbyaceae cyanobacterium bins.59]|nr:DUF192 domain-containing protein [Leptolyngbyaceae cyanobacterium bins.59]